MILCEAVKLPKVLLLMHPSQTLSTDINTASALFFHWRSSPKEDVVYCTSLWHNPRKSLKRRNQLCDGSQRSSQWSQYASDTPYWWKQLLLCSVVLVQIIKATDSCEGVLWRFVLADVWLGSIQHTNTVVLCLRLAEINGHPHKGEEFQIKPWRIEERWFYCAGHN